MPVTDQCAKDYAKCLDSHNVGDHPANAGKLEGSISVQPNKWGTPRKLHAQVQDSKDGTKRQVRPHPALCY